jgi:hypothetical protein
MSKVRKKVVRPGSPIDERLQEQAEIVRSREEFKTGKNSFPNLRSFVQLLLLKLIRLTILD